MPKKRDRLRRVRMALSERQNHRCAYCGQRMDGALNEPNMLTIDHLSARAHGGRTQQSNLVAACLRCNGLRGTERPTDFFRHQRWNEYA